MATPSVEEIRRRKGYMKSQGMKWADMDNDSWGPGQNALWKKATTREKTYKPTVLGALQHGWDYLTGNTTYQTDYPEGEIRQGSTAPQTNLAGSAGAISMSDPRVMAGLGAAALTVVPLLAGRDGYNEAMGVLQSGADRIKRGAENTYRQVTGMFQNSGNNAGNNSGNTGNTGNASGNTGNAGNSGTANAGTQQSGTQQAAPAGTGTAAPQPDPNDPNQGGRRQRRTRQPVDKESDAYYKKKGWQPLSERPRFWSIEHPVRYARQYPYRALGRTAGAVGALTTWPAREYFWPNVGKLWTGPGVPGDSLQQPAPAVAPQQPVEDANDHISNGYINPTDTITI